MEGDGTNIGSLPSRERGLKFQSCGPGQGRTGSLPSRERGLKYRLGVSLGVFVLVAPFTGAWIEIDPYPLPAPDMISRSLHGSVD